MGLKYPAWFATEEDTGEVMVKLYDMPHCNAGGVDVEDAIRDAIAILEDGNLELNYFNQGRPVPFPSQIEDVPTYLPFLEMDVPVGMVELPEDMSKQILEHNERCARGDYDKADEDPQLLE